MQRREIALEPDLPIVNAHHHLWDRQTGRYLLHEFSEDIQSSGLSTTVIAFLAAMIVVWKAPETKNIKLQ